MSQLTDNLNTIASIKGDIRDAIQAKGVNMSGVAFSGFASKIGEIQTGGGQKPEETLVESITSNGSYSYSPQTGYVFDGATISVDVHPSTSLSATYTANGTYAVSGEFSGGQVVVSVPGSVGPSMSTLTETITSNGSYSYSAPSGYAYDSVGLSVSVHPSTSLSRTYTSNSTYNVSGEFNGATITVSVPNTTVETMTQASYNNLVTKDPNTIYLING